MSALLDARGAKVLTCRLTQSKSRDIFSLLMATTGLSSAKIDCPNDAGYRKLKVDKPEFFSPRRRLNVPDKVSRKQMGKIFPHRGKLLHSLVMSCPIRIEG